MPRKRNRPALPPIQTLARLVTDLIQIHDDIMNYIFYQSKPRSLLANLIVHPLVLLSPSPQFLTAFASRRASTESSGTGHHLAKHSREWTSPKEISGKFGVFLGTIWCEEDWPQKIVRFKKSLLEAAVLNLCAKKLTDGWVHKPSTLQNDSDLLYSIMIWRHAIWYSLWAAP